ncbi:hypothetical protein C0991_001989 [Blastosporella zonata]|nr:hypothetical protein C0991_001989 [Blastosporella zonata]
MSPVYAIDIFYLTLTLLVTVAYQLLGFAIAWTFRFDKVTDFTGGSNFFLLALMTLLIGNTFHARNIVASVLVMVWAVRIAGLSSFLYFGTDSRFDKIRSHFFKFLGFWIGQIIWVWTVSLPLTILNSPAVSDTRNGGSNPSFGTSRDIAGIILWAVGFIMEAVSDHQKDYGRGPATRHILESKVALPFIGGDADENSRMLCWWGLWTLCLSPTTNGQLSPSLRAAQYSVVVSPVFTMLLLMFASGVPSAEKPQAKRYYLKTHGPGPNKQHPDAWPQYKEYLNRTSLLIPIPQTIYRRLPDWIKKTVLLDFSMYRFDDNGEDGRRAKEEAQSEQRA